MMLAALTAEDVMAADETPVNVLDKTAPVPKDGKEDSWEGPEPGDLPRHPVHAQLYIMSIIGAWGSRGRRRGTSVCVPSHGRCRISLNMSVGMSTDGSSDKYLRRRC